MYLAIIVMLKQDKMMIMSKVVYIIMFSWGYVSASLLYCIEVFGV